MATKNENTCATTNFNKFSVLNYKFAFYKMSVTDEENINVTEILGLLQQLQIGGGHSSTTTNTSETNASHNLNLQFNAFNENDESFYVYKQRLENFFSNACCYNRST